MLNMKETALLGLIISFAAALTVSLILGSQTYEVQLVASPDGQDVYVLAGEPFNISCKGKGGDVSKFFMKWLDPQGIVITEGIPGVVKSRENELFLTFTSPKIEDSGTYTCAATYDNKYNLQYVASINFQGPGPEFRSGFENITTTEGALVQMYCFADGEKPMQYIWYDQNDELISEYMNSSNIRANSTEDVSWLIINDVRRHQQGMYTCTAENSHGLSSKLYNLQVSAKESNDSDDGDSRLPDIKVMNISATSVQFHIPVNGSVSYIEVKYTENRNATEFRTRLYPDLGDIYSIENLIPSGLYSFQFMIPGNNTWSEVYRVTLLPGMPEIILNNMEATSIKLEWSRKIEDITRGTIDKYEIKYYVVRTQTGDSWIPDKCAVTIEVPTSCFGSRYTISGLQQNVYYQLEIRGHTVSGYGETAKQKIYLSR